MGREGGRFEQNIGGSLIKAYQIVRNLYNYYAGCQEQFLVRLQKAGKRDRTGLMMM